MTAGPGGKLLVPIQNYRHSRVDIGHQLTIGTVRSFDGFSDVDQEGEDEERGDDSEEDVSGDDYDDGW